MNEKLICPECGTETLAYTFDEDYEDEIKVYKACVCPNCEWAYIEEIKEGN